MDSFLHYHAKISATSGPSMILPKAAPVCSQNCVSKSIYLSDYPIPYSIVRSGYVLDPSEFTNVQNYIDEYERDLREQKEKVTHMRKYFDTYRALLVNCPIRKLCPDVLLEIFKSLILDGDGIDMGSRYGTWAIRQVCARWRAIVDDTQGLWSKLDFGENYYCGAQTSKVISRTKLCLHLSRSSLLSVTITPYRHPRSFRPGIHWHFPSSIYNEVMKHSHRLHSFTVDMHAIPRDAPVAKFANLRVLRIDDPCTNSNCHRKYWCSATEVQYSVRPDSDMDFSARNSFKYFAKAASLEDVTLNGVPIGRNNYLPWKTLKSLTVSGYCRTYDGYEDFAYSLLAHTPFPQLETLNLEKNSGIFELYRDDIYFPPKKQIILPALRNLRILEIEDCWTQRAVLPHLESFQNPGTCFHSNPEVLNVITRRSGCTVKHVDIIMCPKMESFAVLPDSVEKLTLTMRYDDEVINYLKDLLRNTPLPSLKKLELNLDARELPCMEFSIVEVLIDIIRSRTFCSYAVPISPLSSLKCTISKGNQSVNLGGLEDAAKIFAVEIEVQFGDINAFTDCVSKASL